MDIGTLRCKLEADVKALGVPQNITLYTHKNPAPQSKWHANKLCYKLKGERTHSRSALGSKINNLCDSCTNHYRVNTITGNKLKTVYVLEALKILETFLELKPEEKVLQKNRQNLQKGVSFVNKAKQRDGSRISGLPELESALYSASVGAVSLKNNKESALLWCAAHIAFKQGGRSLHTNMPKRKNSSKLYDGRDARTGFVSWMDALASGKSPAQARKAAAAALRKSLGSTPHFFHSLPETSRLSGADFENPREWAIAEWRLAVEEEIQKDVDFWEETSSLELKKHDAQEQKIILTNVQANADSTNSLKKSLSVFFYKENRTNSTMAVVGPEIVRTWVRKNFGEAWSYSNTGRARRFIYDATELTLQQLEVALTLYDPGTTGPMDKMEKAIETSKAL